MFIIDNTKDEYKDLPDRLNGRLLISRSYDSNGVLIGVASIPTERLKWLVENQTHAELARGGWGHGKGKELADFVRGKSEIIGKKPDGINNA